MSLPLKIGMFGGGTVGGGEREPIAPVTHAEVVAKRYDMIHSNDAYHAYGAVRLGRVCMCERDGRHTYHLQESIYSKLALKSRIRPRNVVWYIHRLLHQVLRVAAQPSCSQSSIFGPVGGCTVFCTLLRRGPQQTHPPRHSLRYSSLCMPVCSAGPRGI